MQISQAAEAAQLPVKTLRYYEEKGLISPNRCANGYRLYAENDVHRLRFVQRARSLGFTIEECRKLLSLYENSDRASADVKSLAEEKIREVDCKLAELTAMKKTLQSISQTCRGDEQPECPILDDLAGSAYVPSVARRK